MLTQNTVKGNAVDKTTLYIKTAAQYVMEESSLTPNRLNFTTDSSYSYGYVKIHFP
jgi:hypothetical protein